MLKILTKVSNFIWTESVAMLVVGGAVIVCGKIYQLGKELGEDWEKMKEAKGEKANG